MHDIISISWTPHRMYASDAIERDGKGPEGPGLNGAEHLSPPPDHYITTITTVSFPPQMTEHKAKGHGSMVRLEPVR